VVALALLALVPVLLWLTQVVLLRAAGLPFRWQINAPDLPRGLKRINRGVTYLIFALLLLGYPLTRGQTPVTFYGRFFPLDGRPGELAFGFAAACLYLALLYLAWLLTDNVRFTIRHAPGRLAQRIAGAPLTALFAAGFEELLFRGLLLDDLLRTFSPERAVLAGAIIFAGAHYVRSVKRYWTFAGHLALGLLFCIAFVVTDALWLSIGLHAGGIVMLMGLRPLIRYTGPPWLVGASIFPYAGAAGIVALLLLTLNVWLRYGTA
jgi:membrane protease YdiL (CAAX protease family)